MKIRHFPAATVAAAAITILHFVATSGGAQEITTPAPVNSLATPAAEPVQSPLSSGSEDVLKLSKAKVHEDVIIAFIQNGNRHFSLSASEILYLRQEGVSDRVLTAMLGEAPPPPQTAPAQSDSNFAAQASAPQYVSSPATTSYVETPVSTVYVGTPTYYSFSNPWPYWSTWYAYPAFSFGFYWGWGWGGCGYWSYPSYCYPRYNYCYGGSWNRYCNGYYSSSAVRVNSRPVATRNQLVSEMRQPSGVNRTRPLVSEMRQPTGVNQSTRLTSESRHPSGANRGNSLVSEGRQPSGVGTPNQANARTEINRTENRSATGRAQPTTFWTGNDSQSRPTRPTSQTATAQNPRTRTVSATGPSGSFNRPAENRPGENGIRQLNNGNHPNSRPTTAWTGGSQGPASPSSISQGAATVPRASTGVSRSPSSTFSRSASPAMSRSMASPSASIQRSSSPSFRSGAPIGAVSRSSMSSPSFSSRGSAASFRGGGFSGGGSRSMASSGGGFRGGGMGGGGGRGR